MPVSPLLAMADIKTAIAAFDRGEENVWDTLATIAQACDTARHRERPHSDAA